MNHLQIEYLEINRIVPYEKNPRRNDQAVEAVAASIREFGFKVPIIIDGNNVIVCGHTRLKAAKKLKLQSVPCIRADDLTEEQIRAFRLADNKTGEAAEWDAELLNTELFELDFDMAQFGFEEHSPDDYADSFSLKEGDRQPFQTMSFTFSDAQVEDIKSAMTEMKQTSGYKNYEGDNENSNGNALWMVVVEWKQRKT